MLSFSVWPGFAGQTDRAMSLYDQYSACSLMVQYELRADKEATSEIPSP